MLHQQYHNLHQLHSGMHNTSDSICLNDDLYYAELEKQILELTAYEEDDDDNIGSRCRNSSASTRKNASNKLVSASASAASSPANYFTWWEKENSGSVPPSVSNSWHKSNGTGVFIPHVVLSRKRHASSPGTRRRIYRQVENNKSHEDFASSRSK